MQPPEFDPPAAGQFLRASPDRETDGSPMEEVTLVGASVRSAAQSARNARYRVIGIDRFGDVDTRQSCHEFATFGELAKLSPREFERWATGNARSKLLPVGGIHGAGVRIVNRLERTSTPIGPSRDQVRRLADTCWLRETAMQAGIGFPSTLSWGGCRPRMDRKSGLTNSARNGWLLKSSDASAPSSGGLGVRWATDAPSATSSCSSQTVLQRWTAGRCFGASYFSSGRDVCLLGVCRSSFHRVGDLPFVYAGSLGPLRLSAAVTAKLERLGSAIVERSGISGLIGADVIIDRDRNVYLIEINPRWTASSELIERAILRSRFELPGESLIGAMVRRIDVDAIRSVVQHSDDSRNVHWKRIIYARRDGRFCGVSVPNDHSTSNIEFADIPVVGRTVRRHEPILSAIIRVDHRSGRLIPETKRCIQRMIRLVQESVRSEG